MELSSQRRMNRQTLVEFSPLLSVPEKSRRTKVRIKGLGGNPM